MGFLLNCFVVLTTAFLNAIRAGVFVMCIAMAIIFGWYANDVVGSVLMFMAAGVILLQWSYADCKELGFLE